MAAIHQPWTCCLFFVFFICIIPLSSCQPNSQNLETFYPYEPPPGVPTPDHRNDPPKATPSTPINQPQQPPPSATPSSLPQKSSSSNNAVAKAVAATAASTLVVAGIFFFAVQRYSVARRRTETAGNGSNGSQRVVPPNEFTQFNGDLKGVIVDENGLDVVYWRKLEGRNTKNIFKKDVQHPRVQEEEKRIHRGDRHGKPGPIQEMPFLQDKSSTSYNQVWQEVEQNQNKAPAPPSVGIALNPVEKAGSSSTPAKKPTSSIQQPTPSPPTLPPPTPPPTPPPPLFAVPKKQNPAPTPPLILAKKNPTPPPPPPPRSSALALSSEQQPLQQQIPGEVKQSSSGKSKTGNANGQVKLKPLHWDKVNTNTNHSMVWDKIDGGSFRFDDDLMEALFGSVATNRKSPPRSNNSIAIKSPRSSLSAPIFILDARKSQNTAIVLRSIAVSRKEILDSLIEGQCLSADIVEKLTRIAPTKEEESQILAFEGDPTRLADAESFLYHLLKAIPSAFTRLSAMLFRLNYNSDILQHREFLQTLEQGCRELRTRGLFLKLLEAILKAGNRMNAGTARGNAQAFNLTALRKLSDVRSSDGKTTLLHFVVEEVVRSEGKRCVINHQSFSHSSSQSSSSSSQSSESSFSKEEREKEYTMFGLPVVGGLSAEFSNVKKAAIIEYDAFAGMCTALTNRVNEIRQLLTRSATCEGGNFFREMESFLKEAGGELQVVKDEQTRVMELVKKTTEYYQAGASNDKRAQPLQLFIIVKDFLSMVDQACVDIARHLQKRKAVTASSSTSSPKSLATKSPVKFPNLPPHFMSDNSTSTSSDSEDES